MKLQELQDQLDKARDEHLESGSSSSIERKATGRYRTSPLRSKVVNLKNEEKTYAIRRSAPESPIRHLESTTPTSGSAHSLNSQSSTIAQAVQCIQTYSLIGPKAIKPEARASSNLKSAKNGGIPIIVDDDDDDDDDDDPCDNIPNFMGGMEHRNHNLVSQTSTVSSSEREYADEELSDTAAKNLPCHKTQCALNADRAGTPYRLGTVPMHSQGSSNDSELRDEITELPPCKSDNEKLVRDASRLTNNSLLEEIQFALSLQDDI